MAPKYVLVLWTKSKKTCTVFEGSFEKLFDENGLEIPISEGAIRTVSIGEKLQEAKVLRICSSKRYLESLLVTKEGNIILHGSKPPPLEHLAGKIKLHDEEIEDPRPEKNILRTLNVNAKEQPLNFSLTLEEASKCNHGCASCCSGTLPPFPKLPDGFVSGLISLAEYFQQFQKITSNTIVPVVKQQSMAKNLHTWQWASREKIELKKGVGVWVDAMKLEKIIGQAEITKKPPHQTLVKSLLTHLLGIEKYIDTSAEKIDRRLLSAVVGYTNDKYPDLAQPIERYYRCINLNRGYMQKRRNEGAFTNMADIEDFDGTMRLRRADSVRTSRKHSSEEASHLGETKRRKYRRSGAKKDAQLVDVNTSGNFDSPDQVVDVNTFGNFDSSDQVIIPLDFEDGEDIPIVSSDGLNQIIVMHDNSNISVPISESLQGNASSSLPSDCEVTFLNVSQGKSNVKLEEDYDSIDGALDIPL